MTENIRQQIPRYIIGAVSMALSGYFICKRLVDPVIVLASVFFLVICATDTLKTKIPNLASLVLTISGFGYHFVTAGPTGLMVALMGLSAGFFLLIAPHLLGGVGAGDVKALAALGALLGSAAIFQVFLYTCMAGGILAIFHYVLERNLLQKITAWKNALLVTLSLRKMGHMLPANTEEKLRFPYAAAIAFGYFSFVTWGGII